MPKPRTLQNSSTHSTLPPPKRTRTFQKFKGHIIETPKFVSRTQNPFGYYPGRVSAGSYWSGRAGVAHVRQALAPNPDRVRDSDPSWMGLSCWPSPGVQDRGPEDLERGAINVGLRVGAR